MDAVEFMKARERMCHDNEYCTDCPLGKLKLEARMTRMICDYFVNTHTEEAVAVVEAWEKEHPIKTMLTDFLEKYPNALLADDGNPQVCVKYLGCKTNCCNSTCKECWNRPLE